MLLPALLKPVNEISKEMFALFILRSLLLTHCLLEPGGPCVKDVGIYYVSSQPVKVVNYTWRINDRATR